MREKNIGLCKMITLYGVLRPVYDVMGMQCAECVCVCAAQICDTKHGRLLAHYTPFRFDILAHS